MARIVLSVLLFSVLSAMALAAGPAAGDEAVDCGAVYAGEDAVSADNRALCKSLLALQPLFDAVTSDSAELPKKLPEIQKILASVSRLPSLKKRAIAPELAQALVKATSIVGDEWPSLKDYEMLASLGRQEAALNRQRKSGVFRRDIEDKFGVNWDDAAEAFVTGGAGAAKAGGAKPAPIAVIKEMLSRVPASASAGGVREDKEKNEEDSGAVEPASASLDASFDGRRPASGAAPEPGQGSDGGNPSGRAGPGKQHSSAPAGAGQTGAKTIPAEGGSATAHPGGHEQGALTDEGLAAMYESVKSAPLLPSGLRDAQLHGIYAMQDRRLAQARAGDTAALLKTLVPQFSGYIISQPGTPAGKPAQVGDFYSIQLKQYEEASKEADPEKRAKALADWQSMVDRNLRVMKNGALGEESALKAEIASKLGKGLDEEGKRALEKQALEFYAKHPELARYRQGLSAARDLRLEGLGDGMIADGTALNQVELGLNLPNTNLTVDSFHGVRGIMKTPVAGYGEPSFESMDGRMLVEYRKDPKTGARSVGQRFLREDGKVDREIVSSGRNSSELRYRYDDQGRLVGETIYDRQKPEGIETIKEVGQAAEGPELDAVRDPLTDMKEVELDPVTGLPSKVTDMSPEGKTVGTTMYLPDNKVEIEDLKSHVIRRGTLLPNGSVKVTEAVFSGGEHKPLFDEKGNVVGAELHYDPKTGAVDLDSLVAAGLVRDKEQAEILARAFPAFRVPPMSDMSIPEAGRPRFNSPPRIVKGDGGRGPFLVYDVDKGGGGKVQQSYGYEPDVGGYVSTMRFTKADGRESGSVEVYQNWNGTTHEFAGFERYMDTFRLRYHPAASESWTTEKDSTYSQFYYDQGQKRFVMATSKEPEGDDGVWDILSKNVSWTFSNVDGFKQLGTVTGVIANVGKTVGYGLTAASALDDSEEGMKSKSAEKRSQAEDQWVYGIISKYQALDPWASDEEGKKKNGAKDDSSRTILALSMLTDLREGLGDQRYNELRRDVWPEQYRDFLLSQGGRDSGERFALAHKKDFSDEEIGKFLLSPNGGLGFGGAGKEFSKRAANADGKAAAFGWGLAAAGTYGADFTFQSLGFAGIGAAANGLGMLAAGGGEAAGVGTAQTAAAAGQTAVRAGAVARTARVAAFGVKAASGLQSYYMNLMLVNQGLELGASLSKGQAEQVSDSLCQLAAMGLTPHGRESEGGPKEAGEIGLRRSTWRTFTTELVTTNSVGHLLGKVAESASNLARGKEAVETSPVVKPAAPANSGWLSKLGYDPNAKSFRLSDPRNSGQPGGAPAPKPVPAGVDIEGPEKAGAILAAKPKEAAPLTLGVAEQYRALLERQNKGEKLDLGLIARPGIGFSDGNTVMMGQGAGRFEKLRAGEHVDVFIPEGQPVPKGSVVLEKGVSGELVADANMLSSRGKEGANPELVGRLTKGKSFQRVLVPREAVEAPTSAMAARKESAVESLGEWTKAQSPQLHEKLTGFVESKGFKDASLVDQTRMLDSLEKVRDEDPAAFSARVDALARAAGGALGVGARPESASPEGGPGDPEIAAGYRRAVDEAKKAGLPPVTADNYVNHGDLIDDNQAAVRDAALHKILGKYVRSGAGEAILVDPAHDPVLKEFIGKIAREAPEILKKGGEKALIERVAAAVGEKIQTLPSGVDPLTALDNDLDLGKNPQVVRLGDLMEPPREGGGRLDHGYGVCRHQNLLAHAVLESLASQGILERTTVVSRVENGHYFTLALGAPGEGGERTPYVIDVTQGQIKAFETGDRYFGTGGRRVAIDLAAAGPVSSVAAGGEAWMQRSARESAAQRLVDQRSDADPRVQELLSKPRSREGDRRIKALEQELAVEARAQFARPESEWSEEHRKIYDEALETQRSRRRREIAGMNDALEGRSSPDSVGDAPTGIFRLPSIESVKKALGLGAQEEKLTQTEEGAPPKEGAKLADLKAAANRVKEASEPRALATPPPADATETGLAKLEARVSAQGSGNIVLSADEAALLEGATKKLEAALGESAKAQKALLERMTLAEREQYYGTYGQLAAAQRQLDATPVRFEKTVGEVGKATAHMDPATNESVIGMRYARLAYREPELMAIYVRHELQHAGDFNGGPDSAARVPVTYYIDGQPHPEYAVTEALAHVSQVLSLKALMERRGIQLEGRPPEAVYHDAVRVFGDDGARMIWDNLALKSYVEGNQTVFKRLMEEIPTYRDIVGGIKPGESRTSDLAKIARTMRMTDDWLTAKTGGLTPTEAAEAYKNCQQMMQTSSPGAGGLWEHNMKLSQRVIDDFVSRGRYEMVLDQERRYSQDVRQQVLDEANRNFVAAGAPPIDAANLRAELTVRKGVAEAVLDAEAKRYREAYDKAAASAPEPGSLKGRLYKKLGWDQASLTERYEASQDALEKRANDAGNLLAAWDALEGRRGSPAAAAAAAPAAPAEVWRPEPPSLVDPPSPPPAPPKIEKLAEDAYAVYEKQLDPALSQARDIFKGQGDVEGRAKGPTSAANRLERAVKNGWTKDLRSVPQVLDNLWDAIGTRLVLKDTSEGGVDKFVDSLVGAAKSGKFEIVEVNNLVGEDGKPYLDAKQLDKIKNLGVRVNEAKKMASGYTVVCAYVKYPGGVRGELQVIGPKVLELANAEHIPYDVSLKKPLVRDLPPEGMRELKPLVQPFEDAMGKLDEAQLASYNQYLNQSYINARNKELGLSAKNPDLPVGFDRQLAIDNVLKLNEMMSRIKKKYKDAHGK